MDNSYKKQLEQTKSKLKEAKSILRKLIAAQTLKELLKCRDLAINLYGYK